jgi:hypothetical protein
MNGIEARCDVRCRGARYTVTAAELARAPTEGANGGEPAAEPVGVWAEIWAEVFDCRPDLGFLARAAAAVAAAANANADGRPLDAVFCVGRKVP